VYTVNLSSDLAASSLRFSDRRKIPNRASQAEASPISAEDSRHSPLRILIHLNFSGLNQDKQNGFYPQISKRGGSSHAQV